MTSFQNIVPFKSGTASETARAHIIRSDAEALEIAQRLAEEFKQTAVARDAQRILPFEEIEAYS